ncbi:ABC1 family-domain-containing protein [Yarrowia lipolytica]|nr:ABC1 family-domain-containing protein [Yarrowia lipolytica]
MMILRLARVQPVVSLLRGPTTRIFSPGRLPVRQLVARTQTPLTLTSSCLISRQLSTTRLLAFSARKPVAEKKFDDYKKVSLNDVKNNPIYKFVYLSKPWYQSTGFRILAVTVGLATLLYLFSDGAHKVLRHTGHAIERIWVVMKATSRCVWLYRKTLKKEYPSEEEYKTALSKCHKKAAEITLQAIRKNSGVYIKLGQHIAALTYIFPPEWTETMIPLQDQCPESSMESIRAMIRKDTGKNLDDLFLEFNEVPMGVASLAQVHKAVTIDGREVAVKVQHPSLAEFVPLDVYMTRTIFTIVDHFFPDYPLSWLSDEMQRSIFTELDFTEEANNAVKTREYFKDTYKTTALRIPEVYWSKRRILVMEFVGGSRLDNRPYLEDNNISPDEVSACLSHIFDTMIFRPGAGLHCDPHGGNLAIRTRDNSRGGHNFEIVLYDHGLYRFVPTNIQRDYAHFWLALIDSNEAEMRKYAKRFANIDEDKFPLFAAAITGRDFKHATSDLKSKRSRAEIENMVSTIASDGLLSDIMTLLHSVPRVVLLIFKTNDLTRHLDETLNSSLGIERTFLIMATYCAKTVLEERRENLIKKYSRLDIRRWIGEGFAWASYLRRLLQLKAYDFGLMVSNLF